jgi:hypothetical protein
MLAARDTHRNLVGKSERRFHMVDIGVYGKGTITLKYSLKKKRVISFNWLRIGISGRSLRTRK